MKSLVKMFRVPQELLFNKDVGVKTGSSEFFVTQLEKSQPYYIDLSLVPNSNVVVLEYCSKGVSTQLGRVYCCIDNNVLAIQDTCMSGELINLYFYVSDLRLCLLPKEDCSLTMNWFGG